MNKTVGTVFGCCIFGVWAIAMVWMVCGGHQAGANALSAVTNGDGGEATNVNQINAREDDAVPPPPVIEKPKPETPNPKKPKRAKPVEDNRTSRNAVPVAVPAKETPPTPEQIEYRQQHQKHIEVFWKYLTESTVPYRRWRPTEPVSLPVGPRMEPAARVYFNSKAASAQDRTSLPHGAIVVAEHFDPETKKLLTVTAWQRVAPGYCAKTDDWYWMHFLADGTPVADVTDPRQLVKRGFVTREMGDAVWVFAPVSRDLAEAVRTGKPPRGVTLNRAGPRGESLSAVDRDTLIAYQAAKAGFVAEVAEGDVWVFREGSDALGAFRGTGKLKDAVSRPAAGPFRCTVYAPDQGTMKAYLGE